MDKIEYQLRELKTLITTTGHVYLRTTQNNGPINNFMDEARPFAEMEKMIEEIQNKYKKYKIETEATTSI